MASTHDGVRLSLSVRGKASRGQLGQAKLDRRLSWAQDGQEPWASKARDDGVLPGWALAGTLR